jgi:hypothetical protein
MRQPASVTESDTQQVVRDVRIAAAARDVPQLTRAVADPRITQHLQEAGEAVLTVLEHDPARATEPARLVAAALPARGWPGDAELAQLLIELVEHRGSERRRIRADLDGVADLLEGPLEMGFGGILDCESGWAWPESAIDDWAGDGPAPDPDADPERYLLIPNEGSREAWEDMRDFAETVTIEAIRERLLDAIDGRGAFSRFRRVLERHDDLRARWYAYSAETRIGRAREWLAAEGYEAMPPQP